MQTPACAFAIPVLLSSWRDRPLPRYTKESQVATEACTRSDRATVPRLGLIHQPTSAPRNTIRQLIQSLGNLISLNFAVLCDLRPSFLHAPRGQLGSKGVSRG
jgi:hypothetical protein